MTGLDPHNDIILEIAAIVTDWDFKEIASYEGIIKHDELVMRQKMSQTSFWGDNPKARDGLLKQNGAGRAGDIIEHEVLEFIEKYCGDEPKVLLAGNSIHQDRRFIAEKWPALDRRLHYRMLDVTAWKVVFEAKYDMVFAKPENHRALDDIRGSIEELKYYLGKTTIR